MNLEPTQQDLLLKSLDVFFLVCEYNSIEQDLIKILLAYYNAPSTFNQKSLAFLQGMLTSKHLSFIAKADFVIRIPEVKKKKISLNIFSELAEARNTILHGIFIMDQGSVTVRNEFFIRNFETKDFQEAIENFQTRAKKARNAIKKIGEILGLDVIDGSISLNRQRQAALENIRNHDHGETNNEK